MYLVVTLNNIPSAVVARSSDSGRGAYWTRWWRGDWRRGSGRGGGQVMAVDVWWGVNSGGFYKLSTYIFINENIYHYMIFIYPYFRVSQNWPSGRENIIHLPGKY